MMILRKAKIEFYTDNESKLFVKSKNVQAWLQYGLSAFAL
ncbi:hypothetical protein SAMN05428975_0585 [Mucilaginibacter sp. OK268]|nr:hypothetical protein SAMN05428975_0585 [Mucilaginibacter sp. OK268]